MDHKRFEKGYLPLFLSYYKPHLNLFLLDMCCAYFVLFHVGSSKILKNKMVTKKIGFQKTDHHAGILCFYCVFIHLSY